MATLKAYRLNWRTGEGHLLLVSVGTGSNSGANPNLRPSAMNLLYNLTNIPITLLASAGNEQDLLCRVFGKFASTEPRSTPSSTI